MTPGVFAITIAYIQDEWPSTHVGRASGHTWPVPVTGGFTGQVLGWAGIRLRPGGRWRFWCWPAINAVAAAALALWLPGGIHAQAQRQPAEPRPLGGTAPEESAAAGDRISWASACCSCRWRCLPSRSTLADPPFHLGTTALSYLFVVFLVGASIVPFAGRLIDARGYRTTLSIGITAGATGALLTLVPSAAGRGARPGTAWARVDSFHTPPPAAISGSRRPAIVDSRCRLLFDGLLASVEVSVALCRR